MRFQHIGLTAKTSLLALLKLVSLRDLHSALEILDDEIESLRATINPPDSPLRSIGEVKPEKVRTGQYDGIEDTAKLERLVKAREKTKTILEGRVGWVGMDQARAEVAAEAAAQAHA